MWTTCNYCSGNGSVGNLAGGRDICWKCNGIGGYEDYSPKPEIADGTPRGPSTPKSRDKSFASLLALVGGMWLFWIGYTRGFGGDRLWDFIIPIVVAILVAKILPEIPVLIRPLRWIATAAVCIAVLGSIAFLFSG